MLRPLALAGLLSLMSLPAFADGICRASGRCDGLATTTELHECLAGLAAEQDVTLNQLYADVQALLDDYDSGESSLPKLKPRLIAAQKVWAAFRDSQCDIEYGLAKGGSAGGDYYSDCLCHLTHHRNEDLRRMLADYGE